ncbi:MAG: hypothetical protein ACREXR_21980, partial [Gammaproteobacteria bacterium]
PLRCSLPKNANPRAKDRKAPRSASLTFIEAKTKRETYEAALAELRHAQLIGRLVDVEDVKRESFACVRAVRDAFLVLPDRLAPSLASEGDARKVHEILSNEIEQVLLGLVKDFQGEEKQASEAPTPQ